MALPDFTRILATYDNGNAPLQRWLPAERVSELGKLLHSRAARVRAQIMVYGLYNAGKSTLLNALMGRAEAPMADHPETSVVAEYPWQGYVLLDTPGIDAPITHEQVATQQLQDSEVVLFVVAAGGTIDEATTWERLVKIVGSGRRVMLVVNNKAGVQHDSRDFFSINDNLRKYLQNAALPYGIDDILEQVPIHWVNAKAALRGRVESKEPLVEFSGILELEQALSDFLASSDRGVMFKTCHKDLQEAIELALMRLHQAGGNEQAQALDKARLQIDSERDRLQSVLRHYLDSRCVRAKSSVVALINDAHRQPAEQAEQAMEDGASKVIAALTADMMTALNNELPATQRKLEDIGQTLADSAFGAAHACVNGVNREGNGSDDSGLSPALKDAMRKMPMGDLKTMTEQGVKKALELGKELLPTLFKGIGKKTMERWAAMAGRWAGPLLQAGIAIYGIYKAISSEKAEKAALDRQTKAVEDAASTFVEDLRQAYLNQIALVIGEVFKPIDEWMVTQRALLVQSGQEQTRDQHLFEEALLALRQAY
ncbi:dGTPase [Pseudomonas sp. BGM005]|nr:dGTPase [Pseudomonas sp. BG5]